MRSTSRSPARERQRWRSRQQLALALELSLGLAVTGASIGCSGSGQVVRRQDDREHVGRVVSGTAYAWYLRGQWFESSRRLPEAEYAYEKGSSEDPRSGMLYAALGRVRCALGDPKTDGTFREGKSRADEPLPVFIEESLCATYQGRTGFAIRVAREAIELDPKDERANRALVAALEKSGNTHAAITAAQAYKLYSQRELSPKSRVIDHDFMPTPSEARRSIDSAIVAGELGQARTAAAGAVSSGEIALRAALFGKTELALEQAIRTLLLDPTDFDARVAALLLRASVPADALPISFDPPTNGSELGVLALGLSVASYDPAAGLQIASTVPETDGRDPLLRELRRRLARVTSSPTASER